MVRCGESLVCARVQEIAAIKTRASLALHSPVRIAVFKEVMRAKIHHNTVRFAGSVCVLRFQCVKTIYD